MITMMMEKIFTKTHTSTTDRDAKLFRKGAGKESSLCYMGHLLTENRNGLIVEAEVTEAGTRQEWDAGSTSWRHRVHVPA